MSDDLICISASVFVVSVAHMAIELT